MTVSPSMTKFAGTNVMLKAGVGIGAMTVAGFGAYFATEKITNVGDWANPVPYANATADSGLFVGVPAGVLAVGGLGVFLLGKGRSKALAAAKDRVILAMNAPGKSAAVTREITAAKQALNELELGTKIPPNLVEGAGIISAFSGAAAVVGWKDGINKSHARMDAPVLQIQSEVALTNSFDIGKSLGQSGESVFGFLVDGAQQMLGGGE